MPVITDRDFNCATFKLCGNLDRPPLIRGIHRVEDQIQQDLLQLIPPARNKGIPVSIAGDDLFHLFYVCNI